MRMNVLSKLAPVAFAVAIPLSLFACGGATPPPADTAPIAAPSASLADAAPPATNVAWKDMDHQQKLDFMAHVVMPQMKKEFADYDAQNFGNINCHTCHGPGAKDGTFKMPNAELPPVPMTQDGFKDMATKQPNITKFMMAKVVPDMAKLLGAQPYDPATKQGFGCHDCHTAGTPTGHMP